MFNPDISSSLEGFSSSLICFWDCDLEVFLATYLDLQASLMWPSLPHFKNTEQSRTCTAQEYSLVFHNDSMQLCLFVACGLLLPFRRWFTPWVLISDPCEHYPFLPFPYIALAFSQASASTRSFSFRGSFLIVPLASPQTSLSLNSGSKKLTN